MDIPPALRYRVLDAGSRIGEAGAAPRFAELIEAGEPWLGAEPSLAEVGHRLLDTRDPALQARGCDWLALFPSVDTVERMVPIVTDTKAPPALRERAIWTLADRQLRRRHPSTLWTPEAVQFADDVLFKVADAATSEGRLASPALAVALRHVQSDNFAAVFARAPVLWGNALECFATAPLARVLAVSIDDLHPQHRVRALRLIATTLGDDATSLLIGRASLHGVALAERLESLFLAITLAGEVHLPRLEEALRDVPLAEFHRQRARWHLANRGVVPTVRGLRIARRLATLPVDERAAKAAQAADDLGVLARFGRHPEPELYTAWAWMVRGAGDPARAAQLVAAHPASQPIVEDLYFHELARRGRVQELATAARERPDAGALYLAIWGRPLAALELAATARTSTPELACARALACYRAGRADLAERILADDLPPAEITDDETAKQFPGPHETWLAEHAAAAHPAISALVRGRDGVIALANTPHHEAEPDAASLEPLAALSRRLSRTVRGAQVFVAGELKPADRATIVTALERAGARVVAGPVPGTEFFVAGEGCSMHAIAQLERQGVRRLRPGEVEGL